MCLAVRITVVGLFFFVLGASSIVSAASEESGNYREETNSLVYKQLDSWSFLVYDDKRLPPLVVILPIHSNIDAATVLHLYNTLFMFVHSDHDKDASTVKDYKVLLPGYFVLNNTETVPFRLLVTEKHVPLIKTKVMTKFAKHDSIINKPYNYSISPGIVLILTLMPSIDPSSEDITLQDYKYLPFLESFETSYMNILSICMIFIILGNLLITASIFKYKYLQTPPNVYVFNLAVSDILQFTTYLTVNVLGPTYTKKWAVATFLISLVLQSCKAIIVWTAVGITIDRYVAICHPFLGRRISTFSRAVKINLAIWAMSLMNTLLEIVYINSYEYVYDGKFNLPNGYIIFRLIMKVVIPMCIILPAYTCMVLTIRKSSKMRQSCSNNEQQLTEKSIKIAAVIALQFIFCWAPNTGAMYVMKFINPNYKLYLEMYVMATIYALNLLGSVLHPALYAMVSMNFRKAFKDIGCIYIGYIRSLLCCGKATANADQSIALNES